MLIPIILLFAVACARPVGPMPPFPDATPGLDLLNPFESPLLTPDIPGFASPIVEDVDPDFGVDASFPPTIPESSHFPDVSFSIMPSVSPSTTLTPSLSSTPSSTPSTTAFASFTPGTSAIPSQTHQPDISAIPTIPTTPLLVTPSSTPLPPLQSQSPEIRDTPRENLNDSPDPDQTPTNNHLRGDETHTATIAPSPMTSPTTTPQFSTSPLVTPRESPTPLSTTLPPNNPRANTTAPPPDLPAPTPGPDGFFTPSPLPPPVMSQRTTCFPASASVTLVDGSVKRMRELAIGDFVHVGEGRVSRVHMFTHRVEHTLHEFVRLRTLAGLVLTVSEGHYVYVGTGLKPAREVRVGDDLPVGDGGFTRVESVEMVIERGLYNPQTEAGDIVVDGIKASVYTEAVKPALAHAALLPLRVAFSLFGVTIESVDRGFPESVPPNLRSLLSAR